MKEKFILTDWILFRFYFRCYSTLLHLLNGVYSSNTPQAQGMLYINKYFNVIGSDYISNKDMVTIQIINPAIATPVSAVTDDLFWHKILEVLSFGSYSCLARP